MACFSIRELYIYSEPGATTICRSSSKEADRPILALVELDSISLFTQGA